MRQGKYLQVQSPKIGKKQQVSFRVGKTLNCEPPYIKGEMDSCWANVQGVNLNNKEQCERAVGLTLMEI